MLQPCKWYKTVVIIHYSNRRRLKEVKGITSGHAEARQIAADVERDIRAVYRLFTKSARVEVGPIIFGKIFQGIAPKPGIYVDDRRVAI